MKVTFLQFAKRQNSTKLPTSEQLAAGIKYEATYLKALTNIDNPVLYIDGVDANIYAYNYCYIEEWGRFYFVVTADLNNEHICKITLELDDLGTFKSFILATSAFVAYSSTDYSALLNDNRVAKLTDVDVTLASAESIFTTTPSYLLSVVGEDGVNVIVPSDPNVIPATLYQNQVTDLVAALCIQWSDAQSCMLELKEVPFAIGRDYVLDHAHIGKIDIGSRNCVNQYFNSSREEDFQSIAIPVTYNDFRLYSFVEAHLYLPFVGTVEIPLESFYPDPTSSGLVKIHMIANPLTGSVGYTLKNGNDEIVAVYTGTCGRTLPLNASSPRDVIGAVTHIISAGTAAISEKYASAVSETVASMTSNVKFKGSVIGSFTGSYGEYLGTDYVLSIEKHKSNIEPSNLTDICGRPCGKVRSMTGLSGYVQTVGFSIEFEANKAVIDSINAKMDAGVYLE